MDNNIIISVLFHVYIKLYSLYDDKEARIIFLNHVFNIYIDRYLKIYKILHKY